MSNFNNKSGKSAIKAIKTASFLAFEVFSKGLFHNFIATCHQVYQKNMDLRLSCKYAREFGVLAGEKVLVIHILYK